MSAFKYHLEGMGTLLDVGASGLSIPGRADLTSNDIAFYRDFQSLASDWQIIGNDLRKAINEYKKETTAKQTSFQFADTHR